MRSGPWSACPPPSELPARGPRSVLVVGAEAVHDRRRDLVHLVWRRTGRRCAVGRVEGFRALRAAGLDVVCNASSTHTPSTGRTCGRPSGAVVASQYTWASVKRRRASGHGMGDVAGVASPEMATASLGSVTPPPRDPRRRGMTGRCRHRWRTPKRSVAEPAGRRPGASHRCDDRPRRRARLLAAIPDLGARVLGGVPRATRASPLPCRTPGHCSAIRPRAVSHLSPMAEWAELGPVRGDDGRRRCPWCVSAPDYVAYHDDEWGRPVTTDTRILEKICLEGFQSGLSWLTILRRRDGFRRAFAGFAPEVVGEFGSTDVERLLSDVSIVRHRGKIEAAIANARATLEAQDRHGSLAALVWSFEPRRSSRRVPRRLGDLPTTTPESVALSKALKGLGFRYVGPTTAYAAMEALGLVNDHLAGCHVRDPARKNGARSATLPDGSSGWWDSRSSSKRAPTTTSLVQARRANAEVGVAHIAAETPPNHRRTTGPDRRAAAHIAAPRSNQVLARSLTAKAMARFRAI